MRPRGEFMRKYALALAVSLTPSLLTVQAYASDFSDDRGESTGGGRTSIDVLTKAMGDLVDVMGKVWSVMTSNPLFVAFLGASLFGVGIWMFRKVKSAAKR